jgi:hypothetical protein
LILQVPLNLARLTGHAASFAETGLHSPIRGTRPASRLAGWLGFGLLACEMRRRPSACKRNQHFFFEACPESTDTRLALSQRSASLRPFGFRRAFRMAAGWTCALQLRFLARKANGRVSRTVGSALPLARCLHARRGGPAANSSHMSEAIHLPLPSPPLCPTSASL